MTGPDGIGGEVVGTSFPNVEKYESYVSIMIANGERSGDIT
jgi:hypothetical protein